MDPSVALPFINSEHLFEYFVELLAHRFEFAIELLAELELYQQPDIAFYLFRAEHFRVQLNASLQQFFQLVELLYFSYLLTNFFVKVEHI